MAFMNELATEQMQKIDRAIAAGKIIEAIKLYRQFSGVLRRVTI